MTLATSRVLPTPAGGDDGSRSGSADVAAPAARPGVVMLLANLDGSLGGAQRQAELLAVALARRGHAGFIVNQAPGAGTGHRTTRDGVTRVALPGPGGYSRACLLTAFLVWAVANRRRFDVIHAHSPSAGLVAGLVGRRLGKPVVVKLPGLQAALALAGRQLACRVRRQVLDRTADVVVAVSTEMMDALAVAGVPPHRTALIPNGVRLGAPAAAPLGLSGNGASGHQDGHVVLYVGRLEPIKGVRRLLPMLAAMRTRTATTLVIVGDGPLRAELEREAVARGLAGAVRFAGRHADVQPFYRAADVFVLPSTSEGLSNALLEAMAAGLPAVASDVGGNRDVIEHRENGFLVDWTTPEAAADVVTRLLQDAGWRHAIGERARRRACAFSIEAIADRYGDLYRELASRRVLHA